ncbi:DsrE family protein [Roseomonas gilardii]|uniref:DsrE family protein n=1 Tax=Roseomonas gilardii TaxID=257708 RepID=UPI0011A364EC|nr:DsrE family protein [Roseomonas gilardii]
MKTLATLVLAMVLAAWAGPAGASSATAEPEVSQKVVYHNNGGSADISIFIKAEIFFRRLVLGEDVTGLANAPYFNGLLDNIRNHINAMGKDHVRIAVVDHSAGVDLLELANNDKAIAGKLDALRGDGVRFLICENTLRGRHISLGQLYGAKPEDVVPSGVAEIAKLEQVGYVYIHP